MDSGDLRIWEYLTNTFDYDNKFEPRHSLETRQPGNANAMPKTVDPPEWRIFNDIQHQESLSAFFQPLSSSVNHETTERARQVNDAEQYDTIDHFKEPITCKYRQVNHWIDQHSSGISRITRPTMEQISTGNTDQKAEDVSVAKSPPLLRRSLLESHSLNGLSSIETMTEPPSPPVLCERSYLHPKELPESYPPSTTSTASEYAERHGRILSHLKFPSFSHIMPPHQEQMNRKLLLRPLSPYNYYYRDERDNIVNNLKQPGDPLPPPISDQSQEKLESLLFQRWFVDPIKIKRRHRRSHGCISFEELARKIAERWHEQPESVYNFYYTVSCMDKRYHGKQLKLIQDSRMGAT